MKIEQVSEAVPSKLAVKIVLPVMLACSLIVSVATVHANGWTREINGGMKSAMDFSYQPFVLMVVGGQDDNIHGLCTFYNYERVPFVIKGMKKADGEFYPYVTMQVANEAARGWKTIGRFLNGTRTVTITVEPKGVSKTLMVDLDAFRPLIGRFRYGRIVLKTGESSEFELKNLSPPKNE